MPVCKSVLSVLQRNCMEAMHQAPQPQAPPHQAAVLATAPFIQKAVAPAHMSPRPSPAPTPAPHREKATSPCLRPPTRRAPTATATETRRRRCWPRVRRRTRGETTPCTARLTPAQWRADRCITLTVREDGVEFNWYNQIQMFFLLKVFMNQSIVYVFGVHVISPEKPSFSINLTLMKRHCTNQGNWFHSLPYLKKRLEISSHLAQITT